MILLVALMLMLAVSGLGVIAMQTAQLEIQVTGNERLDRQSYYSAEATMNVGSAMIGASRDGFWTLMRRSQRAGLNDEAQLRLTTLDFRGRLFIDHSASESTGDAASLTPDIELQITQPVDGIHAAGFSDGFCFKRLTFDASAQLGDGSSTIEENEQFYRTSQQAVRAKVLLGPLECEGD